MKRVILVWILLIGSLLFIFSRICSAEIIVIYDKATNVVYSVSEKDDTIVPENYGKKILSGNLSDFTDENPTNYKLSGTKLVKDIAKISAEEQSKITLGEKVAEEKLIQDEIRIQAIKSLKDKGVVLKYNE